MSMDVKRWFILAAQIIIALAVGFPYMLSIIVGPLNAEKGWAIPTMMLVFTICMWIQSPAMIIFGKLREKWGNRKLAYPIQKKNEGYYVVLPFEAEPTLPKELDRRLRISDLVMRHIIVNKDEK